MIMQRITAQTDLTSKRLFDDFILSYPRKKYFPNISKLQVILLYEMHKIYLCNYTLQISFCQQENVYFMNILGTFYLNTYYIN